MKFRLARECRFGVRPGTPGRVFASSPATPHAVWARVQAPRLQHGPGTRRASRNTEDEEQAGDVGVFAQKKCTRSGPETSRIRSLIRSSWFAARAAAARSPWRARARPARDRGRAGPRRAFYRRARAAFRRGRAFYAPPRRQAACAMDNGGGRPGSGRPGAARGPRPRPAGAETARSRPTRSARRRRRAPAVTSTWSAARGERSRRVRGSRERFRPSGSALQSPPATPQIRLH